MCVRMFSHDIFDVRSKNLAAFVMREIPCTLYFHSYICE